MTRQQFNDLIEKAAVNARELANLVKLGHEPSVEDLKRYEELQNAVLIACCERIEE